MRLTCPNCDAQYEVSAGMIPAEGRDVQCSSCGHVWFQAPFIAGEEEEDTPTLVAPVPRPADLGPRSEPEEEDEEAEEPLDEAALPPPAEPPRRAPLDDDMLSLLREEAERETRARAVEAARHAPRNLEIQPDLGLPEAEPPVRLRIRPRAAPASATQDAEAGFPAPEPLAAPAGRGARRELLPDIERINSTLDASAAHPNAASGPQTDPDGQRRRSGFRSGFLLVLMLALLGAMVYSQAPSVSRSVPQAAPLIDSYVATVDAARFWLDRQMRGLLDSAGS